MAHIPAARALELFDRDSLTEINLSYAEGVNAQRIVDAALGSISLLVGGLGITIMTIAVAERTSEIGLLVARGARRSTVLRLFLGEAVLLSAVGGVLGLAVGIGLVAGVQPARRASRLDPVEALRAE